MWDLRFTFLFFYLTYTCILTTYSSSVSFFHIRLDSCSPLVETSCYYIKSSSIDVVPLLSSTYEWPAVHQLLILIFLQFRKTYYNFLLIIVLYPHYATLGRIKVPFTFILPILISKPQVSPFLFSMLLSSWLQSQNVYVFYFSIYVYIIFFYSDPYELDPKAQQSPPSPLLTHIRWSRGWVPSH